MDRQPHRDGSGGAPERSHTGAAELHDADRHDAGRSTAEDRPTDRPDRQKESKPPPDKDRQEKQGSGGDRDQAEAAKPNFLRRHPVLSSIGVLAVILAAVGVFLWWWFYASHFQSTDDAFIDARQFAISPKVSGYIVDVPVTDNQYVTTGTLIAQIDPRYYQNALAEAEAQRKGASDQIAASMRRSRRSRLRSTRQSSRSPRRRQRWSSPSSRSNAPRAWPRPARAQCRTRSRPIPSSCRRRRTSTPPRRP